MPPGVAPLAPAAACTCYVSPSSWTSLTHRLVQEHLWTAHVAALHRLRPREECTAVSAALDGKDHIALAAAALDDPMIHLDTPVFGDSAAEMDNLEHHMEDHVLHDVPLEEDRLGAAYVAAASSPGAAGEG